MKPPLPAIDDIEGASVSSGLMPVIDAHVHFFPNELFDAVWKWFDVHGWPIRYKIYSEQILEFLLNRGVSHIVGLQYAHKPGAARALNMYMAQLCSRHDRLCGMATVYPGEPDAGKILIEGFNLGLNGVKLHAHVQCFEMQGKAMQEVFRVCSDYSKPLVIHAGREPKSPAYPCDPYAICHSSFVKEVLEDYPDLKICVPHLGADEFEEYARLIDQFDNLWLDTSMALADYLPVKDKPVLADLRSDRVMFGTDFPNLPYAWDREIRLIDEMNISSDFLRKFLYENAINFFNIKPDSFDMLKEKKA